ncbi:hypothetical protein [Catellatospora citrea]|uniref:Uncharacterized protein n=1 Tax=Catellatospora citrea TaxID=53366 RepID=A0A8J3NYS7_9ACTN|nr:hypothetical protein [Catellatospora citrea]RKE05700.1 hypothetical protein C8E86_0510 [Catellatospora citrea]GIF97061.1 hypothetical protein Cci01nite_21550 [Catellatospora citrea]
MAVLRATRELLDRYESAPHAVRWRWESTVVDVVLRHGSRSDAQALLPRFLAEPDVHRRLMPIFAQHGDPSMAGPLLAACTEAGQLREGMPAEVLHTVGFLGYEPAERMLWDHVEGPYPESMNACLGLLHLPCRGLRTEIARALQRHHGAGLFPEFLPVLATKTGDPSWLGRLVEWGDGGASTDCNGGLILGIALHGERARADFTQLLWNPWWEADGGGTGSDRWAYAGARVLGLSMSDLYADLAARLRSDAGTEDDKRHCLETFVALLGYWAGRPWLGLDRAPDPTETCDTLLDLLFEWSTPDRDDSLIGLAGGVLDHGDRVLARLYELENELQVRAAHELEVHTLMTR